MKIFEIIADPAFRQSYLEQLKKLPNRVSVILAMTDYLTSPACEEDICRLQKGEFSFSVPQVRKLFFSGKEDTRTIYFFPEREICLQRLIVYALHKYDDRFSPNLQIGRISYIPWETALRLSGYMNRMYLFTTDIHHCSESINREILLQRLDAFFDDDPQLLAYLRSFVESSQCIRDGVLCTDRCAVPTGCSLSLFLSNLYFRELDACIEPRATFYSRLNDRFIIGCPDREQLQELARTAMEILGRLSLQVNEDETLFINPGETFEYCGKRVSGETIDFTPRYLAALKKNLRLFATHAKKNLGLCNPKTRALLCIFKLEGGLTDTMIRHSLPLLTTDRGLKEIDHTVQQLLREIITGNKGNKKYACSYRELQSYGYKSYVGQYYKFLDQRAAKGKKARAEEGSGLTEKQR